MSLKDSLALPAAILGASLLLSSTVAAGFVYKTKALGDVISVTGSAQRAITSDVAKWRVSLTRTAPAADTKGGYAALKKDLDALQAYLRQSAVGTESITVGTVAVDPIYANYGSPEGVTSYTLRQEVTVESDDVKKLTAVAQGVGRLLGEGALLSTTSLEYYYSKLPELKVEMLGQATEDARARAKRVAESAGARLGKLTAAAQGVLQITAVNSTEISDYGTYDTASIEKQITAVVRASFRVE